MSQKELNIPTDVFTKAGKHHFLAVWSMDERLLGSKQPAINGDATIIYKTWDDQGNEVVCKRYTTSPTYHDLFSIANDLIVESQDRHHVFVEAFVHDPKTDTWELITGS